MFSRWRSIGPSGAAILFALGALGGTCRSRQSAPGVALQPSVNVNRSAAPNTPPAATPTVVAVAPALPQPRELPFGDGRTRVFVPPTAPAGAKLPLVLLLHAFGRSGAETARDYGLDAFASIKQFIYLAPDGTLDPMGRRFWNAGETCCDLLGAGIDDVQRLTALIDSAIAQTPADPRRVFVVGYSNGGFMAHRLACEHAERIAAIVSMAAAGPKTTKQCPASKPVAVLEIHGDRDPSVPLQGGHLFGRREMPIAPPVRAGVRVWAENNECRGDFQARQTLDLLADLPGAETQSLSPEDCPKSAVRLWLVHGGTHYMNFGVPALLAIWDFLSQQHR